MWETLVPILATLGGAYFSTQANNAAAATGAAAQIQGATIEANAITDSTNKAITQEQAGLAQSQQQYQAIQEQAAPAANYLRGVIAGPQSLTPAQQQQLDQAELTAKNQISTSSIAGSGRTAASILRNVDSNFRNNALAQNQQRADSAANTVYGTGSQAALTSAGAPLTAAGTIANLTSSGGTAAGRAIGGGVQQAGAITANAGTANANVTGQAIGDIGSLIASQSRLSRYGDMSKANNDALVNAINGTRPSNNPTNPNV